jgi:hypothetical protein
MGTKKISELEQLMRAEQPIHWGRAVLTGILAVSLMMAFVDVFNMMGLTRFSYEVYLGSILRGEDTGVHNWTVGLLANWVMGAVFGIAYGYFFEYRFARASARKGIQLGFVHAAMAAFAVFPFFNAIAEQIGLSRYANFGFFGFGLDPATPLLLLVGHLVFGATVGLLYGPVRLERVMMRRHEPGQTLPPGHPDAITEQQDAVDRAAV